MFAGISADTEIMWKNTSAFSDPVLPSNAIGNFTELILGHLAVGARHVYEGMTGQFSQICTAMSFEVTQASDWHRQQLQGNFGQIRCLLCSQSFFNPTLAFQSLKFHGHMEVSRFCINTMMS